MASPLGNASKREHLVISPKNKTKQTQTGNIVFLKCLTKHRLWFQKVTLVNDCSSTKDNYGSREEKDQVR